MESVSISDWSHQKAVVTVAWSPRLRDNHDTVTQLISHTLWFVKHVANSYMYVEIFQLYQVMVKQSSSDVVK